MSDFYLIASKLAGFFLNPLHILAISVSLATLCHWLGQLRTLVNTNAIQWAYFLGLTSLWNSLLCDLETQIKRSTPDQISRIIALGGAIDELTTDAHDNVTLVYSSGHMMATLGLTRSYPNTPAIFTRFSSRLVCGKFAESDVVLPFANETIRSTERILLKNRSRNTIKNARYAKELITLGKTGRRLLLTSGFRMPRAFEIFSDHQIGVMPHPTDFQSNHSDRGFCWNLAKGATNSRS